MKNKGPRYKLNSPGSDIGYEFHSRQGRYDLWIYRGKASRTGVGIVLIYGNCKSQGWSYYTYTEGVLCWRVRDTGKPGRPRSKNLAFAEALYKLLV